MVPWKFYPICPWKLVISICALQLTDLDFVHPYQLGSIIVARFLSIWNVRAVSWPVGMLLYPSTTRRCQSAHIARKISVTCLFMCVLPCKDRLKIWCTVSKVITAKFRVWPYTKRLWLHSSNVLCRLVFPVRKPFISYWKLLYRIQQVLCCLETLTMEQWSALFSDVWQRCWAIDWQHRPPIQVYN